MILWAENKSLLVCFLFLAEIITFSSLPVDFRVQDQFMELLMTV
jgi:hypothetical protein